MLNKEISLYKMMRCFRFESVSRTDESWSADVLLDQAETGRAFLAVTEYLGSKVIATCEPVTTQPRIVLTLGMLANVYENKPFVTRSTNDHNEGTGKVRGDIAEWQKFSQRDCSFWYVGHYWLIRFSVLFLTSYTEGYDFIDHHA
jgi:hypothetical protein